MLLVLLSLHISRIVTKCNLWHLPHLHQECCTSSTLEPSLTDHQEEDQQLPADAAHIEKYSKPQWCGAHYYEVEEQLHLIISVITI